MLKLKLRALAGNWQEWGSIVLLFLVFAIVIRSVEQAQWISPQPSLIIILLLAIGCGWLAAKTGKSGLIVYPLLFVISFGVILWQAFRLLPPAGTESRLDQLLVSLQTWSQAGILLESGESTLHFAVFLLVITFITAFIATLFLLKKRNAWIAVFFSVSIILVNLSNLSAHHYTYFYYWIFAVLLLVGLTSLIKQNHRFKQKSLSYTSTGLKYFVLTVLFLSVLVTSLAWFTPEIRVSRVERLMNTDIPWRANVENFLMDFFVAVPGKQIILKSDDQGELLFGNSSFDEGRNLNFIINSERPSYWRMRMYDKYTPSGWFNSDISEGNGEGKIPGSDIYTTLKRTEMTYTVLPQLKTDVVLLSGEYISSSLDTSVQTLALMSFSIDLESSSEDASLPDDIVSLARLIREERETNGGFGIDDIDRRMPQGLILTGVNGFSDDSITDGSPLTTIEVTRQNPAIINTVAVKTARFLKAEQSYSARTSISLATTEDMSEAGNDYPSWVTDYYLQLPETLPERVRWLSNMLTFDKETAYDKAIAIQSYLTRIAYSNEVNAPPEGADGVDYFLFSEQTGNCVNFASSMAVLLRVAGVPTRVSVGYAPGERDETSGNTVLRDKQRHAWPEVYFPGYGWIIFEATPFRDRELEGISFTGNEVIDDFDQALMMIEGIDSGITVDGSNAPVRKNTSISPLGLIIGIISGVVLIFLIRAVFSRLLQPSYRPGYASSLYRRMCFLASLVNLKPEPHQTPLEYYAVLASEFPLKAKAFDNIVQHYVVTRFSRRKGLTFFQTRTLKRSWQEIYPVFIKRFFHLG
ncbi:MAG: transglutaminase domain-containing protein [Dehalococcoidales bacterium]